MSLFNTAGSGGSNLFGSSTNTQQQQPAAGGAFGSTNTAGTNLNAFGQPNANTSGAVFGQPASTANAAPATGGTSLFGSTQAKPTAFGATGGGGLFGQSAATSTQPAQSTGFFSTPPAGQQSQQQPAKPAPVFGSSNPLLPSSASTGTNSLFGASTTNNNNNSTAAPNPFGSAPAAGNTGTTNLFGASSNTGTSSLFGSTNNSSNTAAPATTGNSLFGSTPGGSLFGSSTNNNNNPLAQSTLTTSVFGKPAQPQLGTTSLLKSTAPGSSQQQPADSQAQFERLSQKIESITNAWNPNSPQCRFQHYFYNLVDPTQVHLYGRPQNATNDVLWQKALQENPDSSCLVPVIANGFDDLRQRVEAQTQQSAAHTAGITEVQKRLAALSSVHTADIVPRLARFSQAQIQIAQRIMKLVQHLHLLIPAVRSSAIKPEEEQLSGELEAIDEDVRGNRGKMKAKLDELWAVFGAMRAREEGLRERRTSGEWKVVDDDGLRRIAQILGDQQAGLAHLTKILQKDQRDLGIMLGTTPSITAGDESMTPDTLWTSTNSLRGSAMR